MFYERLLCRHNFVNGFGNMRSICDDVLHWGVVFVLNLGVKFKLTNGLVWFRFSM